MWLFGIVLSKLWPFIWESRDLQKFTFSSYREKNYDAATVFTSDRPDQILRLPATWWCDVLKKNMTNRIESAGSALGCSSTMMVAEIGSKPSHGWGDGVGHHIEFCWPFDGWWYDPFFFEWVTTSHDVGIRRRATHALAQSFGEGKNAYIFMIRFVK